MELSLRVTVGVYCDSDLSDPRIGYLNKQPLGWKIHSHHGQLVV